MMGVVVSAALRRDAASWQTLCDGPAWAAALCIMACGVASYGWRFRFARYPMMGRGPVGAKGMLLYCVGLAISRVMGFVLTFFHRSRGTGKRCGEDCPLRTGYAGCRGGFLLFEKMC